LRIYYQRSQAIKTDVIKRQSLEFAHAKCGMAGIGEWGGNSPAEYWHNPIRAHEEKEADDESETETDSSETSSEETMSQIMHFLGG